MSQFPELYITAAVSTAHLTEKDEFKLRWLVPMPAGRVAKRDTGYFIKLWPINNADEREVFNQETEDFSDGFQLLMFHAIMAGIQCLELDSDAQIADGYPTHNW